jgi:hypothetical protein
MPAIEAATNSFMNNPSGPLAADIGSESGSMIRSFADVNRDRTLSAGSWRRRVLQGPPPTGRGGVGNFAVAR